MANAVDNSENHDSSTCAHYPCNCQVQPGERYCCDSCAQQENDDDVCSCGHSECQQE